MANYQMSKYVKKVKYSENEIILFNRKLQVQVGHPTAEK